MSPLCAGFERWEHLERVVTTRKSVSGAISNFRFMSGCPVCLCFQTEKVHLLLLAAHLFLHEIGSGRTTTGRSNLVTAALANRF
jgi:hypothetical protein